MLRVCAKLTFFCWALLSVSFSSAAWAASKDTNYTNARFAFALLLPPGHSALLESDNGDGMRTTYAGGLNITVWGSNTPGVLDQSLTDVRADVEGSMSEVLDGQVNHEVEYFIFKGVKDTDKGKSGYYTKQFVRKGVLMALEMTWPLPKTQEFEPLVTSMGRAFRPVGVGGAK